MGFKNFCKEVNGKIIGNKCKVNGINVRNEENFFNYKPGSQQFKVFSPREFLNIVPPEPFKDKKHQQAISQSIKQGKPISPPFIDVDVDSCKVLAHEGRNRAIASQMIGIKKYPLIIYNKEFDKDAIGMFGRKGQYFYTDRKNKCKNFKRQDW